MARIRDRFSSAEARRIALAAQGFAAPRPDGAVDAGHLRRAIDRLGLLQIDSVNVLARAHYLPLQARLGDYDMAALDRLAYGRRRHLFEYWGHAASLLPVALQPLLRWRMARAESGEALPKKFMAFIEARRPFVDGVLAEIRDRGPLGASEITGGGRATGPWWGWSDGKTALEWLFYAGRVTTQTRRNFERVYDLTERVLPTIAALPTPPVAAAQGALIAHAAAALGIATDRDLADYFRIGLTEARARIAERVEAGDLRPVAVEGWAEPAYIHRDARLPRRVDGSALLSPFDPLIWERERTLRLFGFHYRISIYTPAAQRAHGYYVMPFLLGDRLVGRVDLKADRAADRLSVPAAHAEPGTDPRAIAPALRGELALLARWLGLATVQVGRRGDLAAALRRL
ncbi:MAG: winged helix-turn-helix domain-containing protein [Alphaproteobacteria bacterium]